MYQEVLAIKERSAVTVDEDCLETFRFENGSAFPPSYQKFCKELGYGRLCNLFLVYIPLGDHPDSWLTQREEMKDLFLSYTDPPLYSILEVENGLDLIKRGEPFARSENGEFLFWDLENPLPNGELPIYFTDFSLGIKLAGVSLLEFILNVTSSAHYKSILHFYQKPLEASFEGFKELIW